MGNTGCEAADRTESISVPELFDGDDPFADFFIHGFLGSDKLIAHLVQGIAEFTQFIVPA